MRQDCPLTVSFLRGTIRLPFTGGAPLMYRFPLLLLLLLILPASFGQTSPVHSLEGAPYVRPPGQSAPRVPPLSFASIAAGPQAVTLPDFSLSEIPPTPRGRPPAASVARPVPSDAIAHGEWQTLSTGQRI